MTHSRRKNLRFALAELLEPRRLLAAPAVSFIQGAGYSASGFTPTDVAYGRFNADALPDLVVGGVNQARILAGNGRGGFTLASTINTGFTAGKVVTGDLNNDGFSDIVISKLGTAEVHIYLGNGDGTVRNPSDGGLNTMPAQVNDIALGDLDNDGKLDFIFAGPTSGVFWGLGDGTMEGAGVNLTANPSWVDYYATTADLDHDGRLDVVTAGIDGTANPVHFSFSHVGRTFTYDNQGYQLGGVISSIASGDFTGDGIVDVVATYNDSASKGYVAMLVNTGLGHSVLLKTTVLPGNTPTKSIVVGDFDKDLKLDIALGLIDSGTTYPNSVLIMGGKGDGFFDGAIVPVTAGVGNPVKVLAPDLNQDTKLDLVSMLDSGAVGSDVTPTTSGVVFDDANENGAQDTGELGVAGRTVYEDVNANGTLDAGETTAVTDASGTFQFGFQAGTHLIRQVITSNQSQTYPTGAPGPTLPGYSITVTNGTMSTGWKFGLYDKGTISGSIWNDFNANGVFDQFESARPGQTVFIDANNNYVLDAGETSAVTNPLGHYRFILPAGTYRVRQAPAASWYVTSPNSSASYAYLLNASPASPASGKDFGQTQLGTISGRVYYDKLANGYSDDSDPGLSGFTVFIDSDYNGVMGADEARTTTNAQGAYSFANLYPAAYSLRVIKPAGWVQISPTLAAGATDAPFNTRANGGFDSIRTDFGIIYPSYVSGRVFNDLNGDGIQTGGENGLSGFGVFVDVSATGYGSLTDPTTQTDSLGNYTLRVPVDGTYNVRVTRPSSWQSTVPSSNAYSVVFSNGSTVSNKNFGLKQGAFNNAGFKNPVNFGASQFSFVNPASVVTGNFNADNKQDFAVANNSGDVTVFVGDGLGGFTRSSAGFGGSGKRSIISAKLNGDNYSDLITANQDDGTVSVFLGNGAGGFPTITDYPAVAGAYSLVAADFTGDGALDLVVGGISGTQIVLLPGNGSGGFGAPINIGDSAGTYGIAVGDFNNDNKKDLAWVNQNTSSVIVRLGNGNGTFQTPVTITTGINQPGSIALGDFNKDTFLDMAVVNSYSDIVRIITGKGDGTFNAGVNYGTGSTPSQVTTLDVDGDGWLDLAIAYKSDGTTDISGGVNIFRNHGDGTFEAPLTCTAHTSPNSLAVGDFNGDQLPDVVATNFFGDDVSVMINSRSASASVSGVVIDDLNGNGVKDPGEGFLASCVLYLDLDNDSTFDPGEPSTTTDLSGNFIFPPVSPGQYTVRVSPGAGYAQTLPAAGAGITISATAGSVANLTFAVHDVAAPGVFDAQFLYSAAATPIRFVFTENVGASLTVSDFQLVNRTTAQTIAPANMLLSYNTSTFTASLTFPGFAGGMLPDGDYRVTLPAGSVTDAAGNPLAADYSFDFFVFKGDANRDRVCDVSDLALLAAHYGTVGNMTWADGDFNGDGTVDVSDLALLAANYGQILAAPAAAPAVMSESVPAAMIAPMDVSTAAVGTGPTGVLSIQVSPAAKVVPAKSHKLKSKVIFAVTPVIKPVSRPKTGHRWIGH